MCILCTSHNVEIANGSLSDAQSSPSIYGVMWFWFWSVQSVEEQVDFLLGQACSVDNLCEMYEGWTPWIWRGKDEFRAIEEGICKSAANGCPCSFNQLILIWYCARRHASFWPPACHLVWNEQIDNQVICSSTTIPPDLVSENLRCSMPFILGIVDMHCCAMVAHRWWRSKICRSQICFDLQSMEMYTLEAEIWRNPMPHLYNFCQDNKSVLDLMARVYCAESTIMTSSLQPGCLSGAWEDGVPSKCPTTKLYPKATQMKLLDASGQPVQWPYPNIMECIL